MAIWEVQGPDGNIYQVDAPDMNAAGRVISDIEAGGNQMVRHIKSMMKEQPSEIIKQPFKGVPVLGALVDPGIAATKAALQPFAGTGAPDENFSDRFYENLGEETRKSRGFETRHPADSTQLQLAGGALLTAPLTAAAPVARAMGMIGPMAQRIPLSSLSSGVLSSADEYLRNGDPARGAWVGAGLGGGVPIAGKIVGAGTRKIAELLAGVPAELSSMSGGARKALAATTSPNTTQRLGELGPDAFLFEGNPGTFQLAQGVTAARPGPAQSQMVQAVTDRERGNVARLRADTDAALGPYQDPSVVERGLAQRREQVGRDYPGATYGTQRIDAKPIVQALNRDIELEAGAPKKTLTEIKGYLYGQQDVVNPTTGEVTRRPRLKTSADELLNVRQAIDDLISRTTEPNALRVATAYRGRVDQLMPRTVKAVDDRFSELERQSGALERGGQVLRGGPEAPTVEGLRNEMMTGGRAGGPMSAGQQDMLRTGARGDIERMIGTKANDVQALRNLVGGEGDWNRQKLSLLFGQNEADRIIGSVDRERAFQDAYRKLVENSQTAQRQAAAKMVGETVGPEPPSMRDMTVLGAALTPLQKGWRAVRDEMSGAARTRADEGLAQALTTQGATRDRIVQALEDYSQRTGRAGAYSASAERIAQLLAMSGATNTSRWAYGR